ncbi:MAG: hypothetical protein Q8K60_00010 [Parachlamydiaceae bacterium]|nr:hypothetical protein [Parachlamydiaceae bacterium]
MSSVSSIMPYSPPINNLELIPFINADKFVCLLSKVNKSDEQIVKEYCFLCEQFHLNDFIDRTMEKMSDSFNQGAFNRELDAFKIRLKEKTDEYFNKLADGKNQLIVISCKDDIIAGTFYELENNGALLWIQAFSFDRDDKQENQLIYSVQILDYLSSLENFPKLQVVVVMVRKTSSERNLLFSKDFKIDEAFHREGYDKNIYDCFVKTIQ